MDIIIVGRNGKSCYLPGIVDARSRTVVPAQGAQIRHLPIAVEKGMSYSTVEARDGLTHHLPSIIDAGRLTGRISRQCPQVRHVAIAVKKSGSRARGVIPSTPYHLPKIVEAVAAAEFESRQRTQV